MKRLLAFLAFTSLACGPSAGSGKLAIALTDAPSQDVKSIFVTLRSVTAHSDQGGWVSVFDGKYTVDLLTLQNKTAPLGEITLPAGNVSQIRLELDPAGPQYVVLADGTQANLTVPSGTESGIKLVGSFPVNPCSKHTVTLDFDGQRSVSSHPTGANTEWILRPVVRVKAEDETAIACPVDGGTPDGAPDAGSSSDGDGGTILH